ncbi:hypothetical protein [Nocardioides campestrisoli]|uniref:hypothetical protein n=1 Tax=Nocardioides campestrisoli TaxID=2736757 RepID=UPI00163D91D4|nr:hypothetical protein [Nocardioides campestrisoli]
MAAALLAVCAPAPTVASAPPRTPAIGEPPVFDAPAGGKGGIQNPFVHCHSYRIEPRAVMAIVNSQTGWLSIHRWRGALPGVRFPRLRPGTYQVETTVWCGRRGKTARRTVTIKEKTREGTLSRAEFDAVRRGMTYEEVTALVGTPGRDPSTSRDTTSITYDNMAFWAWSIIEYRNDRVRAKYWKVGHD